MSHANPGFAVGDLVTIDGDHREKLWTITQIVTDDPEHDGPYAILHNEGGGRSWSALRILWHVTADLDNAEPSMCELDAIEAEWPQIEAGLTKLDDEIRARRLAEHGPSELDRRRVRRAAARSTRDAVALSSNAKTGRHTCDPWRRTEIRMSDCRYGCKVMRCDDCDAEQVEHRAAYGCPIGRAALRPAA